MSQVFIGRQPILDRDMNVFAYELQFHQGTNPNTRTLKATAELIKEIDETLAYDYIRDDIKPFIKKRIKDTLNSRIIEKENGFKLDYFRYSIGEK